MDKRGELQSTLRIEDVPTVRSMVAQKLREAIMSGTLKPGQRLIERELCEMTGVSRTSVREGFVFCDTSAAATDPVKRGRPLGSPDGLHPGVEGHRRMGHRYFLAYQQLAGERTK